MTDKQLRIISAAIEAFAVKGFAATSTSEIAKKAGVAEGTIFHYYKTKKDLLLAIPDYLCESLIADLFLHDFGKIFEHPPEKFEDFLREIIQNRMNFASQNMILLKVLFQEAPFQPELLAKITENIFAPIRAKFIRAIEKLQAQGKIIDIPSTAVFNLLVTTIMGYICTKYVVGLDTKIETDLLIRFIMDGLSTCKD
jgi:AcrR family transcriptional regulator